MNTTLLEKEYETIPLDQTGNGPHRLTFLTACPVDSRAAKSRNVAEGHWTNEAEFILSALETGRAPTTDRRASGRLVIRTLAELRLYSDPPGETARVLYSRDATTRGLGFITRRRLPLGYGGLLQLRGPNDEELSIACTIRRCRETVNGWYEGSINFNREQWAFDRHNTKDAD